jgi:sugar/nucleoside kinase (ribokinase family)
MSSKSIIGIGNALMDIVVKLPNDNILIKNSLPKGSMILVDASTSASINSQTENLERIMAPGGSVANTVDGLAHLGANAAFVGKVGNDELGKSYHDGLISIGAKPILFQSSTPTGIAMALVTPDSERTFGTYLGAAIELSPEDLTLNLFAGYDIAYIEGYLVQNHELVRKAVSLAREAGLTIALDLSSYNVVETNLGFLNEIISEYVDIIFANEEEAKVFTGKNPGEAISELADMCGVAVVKIGEKGSLIKHQKKLIKIEVTSSYCIDTTGAGDLYAAGFLYGISRNLPLPVCGKIASIVAGKVITVYGARMDKDLWDTIIKEVEEIIGN